MSLIALRLVFVGKRQKSTQELVGVELGNYEPDIDYIRAPLGMNRFVEWLFIHCNCSFVRGDLRWRKILANHTTGDSAPASQPGSNISDRVKNRIN